MFGWLGWPVCRKKTANVCSTAATPNNHGDLFEDCLDPEKLAENLARVFLKKTSHSVGHIHFYFRNTSDHVILIWAEGKLAKVLAKSPHCEKGEYTRWSESQFCDHERKAVFKTYHPQISRIEIDEGLRKSWPSYPKFINWLAANQ